MSENTVHSPFNNQQLKEGSKFIDTQRNVVLNQFKDSNVVNPRVINEHFDIKQNNLNKRGGKRKLKTRKTRKTRKTKKTKKMKKMRKMRKTSKTNVIPLV